VGPIGPKFHDFLAPTLEGGVRRYNLNTGRPLNDGPVCPGNVVVSADGKREVTVLDVDKNAVLARVVTIQAATVSPLLSPDGTTLVTFGPPIVPPTLRLEGLPPEIVP